MTAIRQADDGMNSTHQLWSKWVVRVTPPPHAGEPSLDLLTRAVARHIRQAFGTGGRLRVYRATGNRTWIFTLIVDADRHPHDPADRARMEQGFVRLFQDGFGMGTRISIEAILLAGERLDGSPPERLFQIPATGPFTFGARS